MVEHNSFLNALDICKQTRTYAVKSLYAALKPLLESETSFSEIQLRDTWAQELKKNSELFANGWYSPPPHGIGVLIGDISRDSRICYSSLRPESSWPSDENRYNKTDSIMYVYASPTDRRTGIIGDFGMTIYDGQNAEMVEHLKTCFTINQNLFNYAQVGMTLSDLYNYASDLFKQFAVTNQVTSITDPTGANIGHTIPFSYEAQSPEEKQLLEQGASAWPAIVNMISKKRRFVNAIETLQIQPGMALTLEPRVVSQNHPDLPMSSFHTIVAFYPDGHKELLTNFEELFKLTNMQYLEDTPLSANF